jgi:hypothetical protein
MEPGGCRGEMRFDLPNWARRFHHSGEKETLPTLLASHPSK